MKRALAAWFIFKKSFYLLKIVLQEYFTPAQCLKNNLIKNLSVYYYFIMNYLYLTNLWKITI